MQTIGIITSTTDSIFHQTVFKGADDEAKRHHYETKIMLHESPDDPIDLDGIDGLLIISNTLPDEKTVELHKRRIPISLVSHHISNITVPSVMPYNEQGMVKIVNYLVNSCGYTSFVFIRGDMRQDDGIEREQIFRRELLRHIITMPETHFIQGDFLPETAAESMREFLQYTHDFEAVIVSDFLMAVAVKDVIEKTGLRIPQDVAVIAFGDGTPAQRANLTTVDVNVLELGKRAVQQIIGQRQGLTMRGITVVHTQIIERGTCLPLRAKSINGL